MRTLVCLCVFLGVACTSTMAERELCYAKADVEAVERAERECPDGGAAWDACKGRQAILDELAAKYRRCP